VADWPWCLESEVQNFDILFLVDGGLLDTGLIEKFQRSNSIEELGDFFDGEVDDGYTLGGHQVFNAHFEYFAGFVACLFPAWVVDELFETVDD